VGWGYSARLFAAASSLITSLLVSVERQILEILVVLETSASKSIAGLEIQRIMEQKQSKMGHAVWRKRWKQQ